MRLEELRDLAGNPLQRFDARWSSAGVPDPDPVLQQVASRPRHRRPCRGASHINPRVKQEGATMIRKFLASGLVALVVGLLAVPVWSSSECDGIWTPTFGLQCINACTQGCVAGAWSTPQGTGRGCQCDIIGPQPNCCRLVVVPDDEGGSILTHTGSCSAPGCPTSSGNCSLLSVEGPEGQVLFTMASCGLGGVGG